MNIDIPKILKKGEGTNVEFKKSVKKLPDSLFETICAFLNRSGGTILLGVNDDKSISGIDFDLAQVFCKDIANLSNNPQKLFPSFLFDAQIVEYEGKYFGLLTPNNFEPFPKNPHIAQIFTQMGRSEELGTGIRNVFRYTNLYSGSDKISFQEEDVFVTTIPLDEKILYTGIDELIETTDNTENVVENVVENRFSAILDIIRTDNTVSAAQLARQMNVTERTAQRDLEKLKAKGIIDRIGADKGGYWKILKGE